MDTTTTNYIDFREAARLAPGKPDPATVWRWARVGLTARNGDIIQLRHIRVGGRLFTTPEWMDQFFAEVTDADIRDRDRKYPASMSAERIQTQLKEEGL